MTHRTDSDRLPAPVRPSLPVQPDQTAELDVSTLNALTELFDAIDRVNRSSRPIVLHSPADAADARTRPGPEPINVRIPFAPADDVQPQPDQLPRLFVRAEVSYFMGATALITGGVSTGLDLAFRFGALPFVLIGAVWTLMSAAAINHWAKRYGGMEVIHGRVKPRPGSEYR
jgi:hypothetical protein